MSNQITLGELITLLEARPQDQGVMFDFGALVPVGVDSYRGYYDHLAIDFAERGRATGRFATVADLLKALKAAVGASFTGYKGGSYAMWHNTPLWAANYGETGSTAIVGLCDCDWTTVIKTEWIPQ